MIINTKCINQGIMNMFMHMTLSYGELLENLIEQPLSTFRKITIFFFTLNLNCSSVGPFFFIDSDNKKFEIFE